MDQNIINVIIHGWTGDEIYVEKGVIITHEFRSIHVSSQH